MHPTVSKYCNGGSINDQELDFLIDLYSRLARDLKFLGLKYGLAWFPIALELEKLEGYKRARQEKH